MTATPLRKFLLKLPVQHGTGLKASNYRNTLKRPEAFRETCAGL